jgi:RNase P subunit RPR2
MAVAFSYSMDRICQHCTAPFSGAAYRVTSKESGVIVLDMIVCQHCCEEARQLGLSIEELGFDREPAERYEMVGKA